MPRLTPRRYALRASVALGSAALLAACADQTLVAPTAPGPTALSAAKLSAIAAAPRYLVGLARPGVRLSAATLAAAGGARVARTIPALNVLVVDRVTNPAALKAAGVAYVEEEFTTHLDDRVIAADAAQVKPLAGASAPWYQSGVQWDMKAMHADAGWSATSQGEGVNVCIVDTGVDGRHQELAGRVSLRANFVDVPDTSRDNTVEDLEGHGSHVAGTAAAGGVVISGVAPRATVMSARVLDATGSGFASEIINGMLWCADNGAHVINASLGGRRFRFQGNAAFNAYAAAIKYATDRGVVVVVAAGNDNLRFPNRGGYQVTIPAEVPGALDVGATGPVSKSTNTTVATGFDPFNPAKVWQGVDGRASYSNYGPGVDVFAPGGGLVVSLSSPYLIVDGVFQGGALDDVYSVCAGTSGATGAINVGGAPAQPAACAGQTNRYLAEAGTSMASPHVAGMAAVLYGELGGARSAANRLRVESCITRTADNIGPAEVFGAGRVNVQKALAALRAGTC